jgi:hypothetical protein
MKGTKQRRRTRGQGAEGTALCFGGRNARFVNG